MTNPFEYMYRLFDLDPCRKYNTHESLFLGLAAKKTDAIQCLMLKSRRSVVFLVKSAGLSEAFTDDVVNEAVFIMLKKIEDGQYRFEGHAPGTYLVEIARRVALNFSRKPGFRTFDTFNGAHEQILDDNETALADSHGHIEHLEQLLNQLDAPCRDIISIYYLDGFSDQEVVSRQLVPISTTDSLKARRSQCMKKLRLLANSAENSTATL